MLSLPAAMTHVPASCHRLSGSLAWTSNGVSLGVGRVYSGRSVTVLR
jgi:hypothetical protein